jgi:hypothetical protein
MATLLMGSAYDFTGFRQTNVIKTVKAREIFCRFGCLTHIFNSSACRLRNSFIKVLVNLVASI